MRAVGIICEYNPFHMGHAYQIAEIKKKYPGVPVVCALSGGFVQRGEPAMFSAYDRARAAVCAGADLCVLLPFPYSAAPAEIFARAGVSLLSSVGCDVLAFGTEGDVLPRLSEIAGHLSSPEFSLALRTAAKAPENAGVGFPILREQVYVSLYGEDDLSVLHTPNNTLAAEYLRALPDTVTPLAVPRIGAGHDESTDGDILSGSRIRELIRENDPRAFASLPAPSADIFSSALSSGHAVLSYEKAAPLLLYHYRNADTHSLSRFALPGGGLAGRLIRSSREASSVSDFFSLAETKKYTSAAVRRAAWFGFFGITEEELRTPPMVSLVLAGTKRGMSLLRETETVFLSKPSSGHRLPPPQKEEFSRLLRAEAVWGSLALSPVSEADLLRMPPWVI